MLSKNLFLFYFILQFFVINSTLLFIEEFDIVIVYSIFSIFYFVPLFLSSTYSNLTLFFFNLLAYLINGLGSVLFFLSKSKYKYAGFGAIKDFDFSVYEYVTINFSIFVFILLTTLLSLIIDFIFIRRNFQIKNIVYEEKNHNSNFFKIFIMILFFASVNTFMFSNGIGLTGVGPPELPYKLSGILYYFARFIIPLLIFLVYSKSNKSIPTSLLIIAYAFFASITSVSRTVLILVSLPVIFFSIINNKKFTTIIYSILVLLFFPFVGFARNFVYILDTNKVYFNSNVDLLSIIEQLFNNLELISLKDSFYGLILRLGGNQDVVLGYYYKIISSSFDEFSRVFLFSEKLNIVQFQYRLFGFTPREGWSPGDGSLLASVNIISDGNLLWIFLIAVFISLLILTNEFFIVKISKIYYNKSLMIFLALIFSMILLPMLSILWLYSFMIIIIFTYFLLSFFKKYLSK